MSDSDGTHDSFYGPAVARIHAAGFTRFAESAADLLLHLAPDPELPIVEYGCGAGDLAARVCAAGFQYAGYDVSASFVQMAQTRVPDGRFALGSWTQLPVPRAAAIVAVGEVLNYQTDPLANRARLRDWCHSCAEDLPAGGVLLFDLAAPDRATGSGELTFGADTIAYSARKQGDTLIRHITVRSPDGEVVNETHELRLYDVAQVRGWLVESGFAVEVLPGYPGVDPVPGWPVFCCRKP